VLAIRSDDTDVFVLLIHNSAQIDTMLWMDAGGSSDNSRRFIDVSAIVTNLTPGVCRALSGFHAFTGCDFAASFPRKGKSRLFELMVKDSRYVEAFSGLGRSSSVAAEVAAVIEEFVCILCGVRTLKDVNLARFHLFRKLCLSKKGPPIQKIKSSHPCCLPPCRAVLEQKLIHSFMFIRRRNNTTEAL